MPDRELDVGRLTGWSDSYAEDDLRAAIDAAIDHGEVTWLTVDGRRIARIVPAGDAPAGGTETAPPSAEAHHTGLMAHDGYVTHSHEVRADHLGVQRTGKQP